MFTCPKCRGGNFGTVVYADKPEVGHCNTSNKGAGCSYEWERSKENDALVFKPDYEDLEEEIEKLRSLITRAYDSMCLDPNGAPSREICIEMLEILHG